MAYEKASKDHVVYCFDVLIHSYGKVEAAPAVLFAQAHCALQDKRFSPISQEELPHLSCTVSFLHTFEKARHWQDWEIGTHGLIIEFRDPNTHEHRSATYLPEIAAAEGWTKQSTVDSLIRKAGYAGSIGYRLKDKLTLTRYQSTAHMMTHKEYITINTTLVDPTPAAANMPAVAVQA